MDSAIQHFNNWGLMFMLLKCLIYVYADLAAQDKPAAELRCTATLTLLFFVPMMLVATQSYKPVSAGIKLLMVSVPWFIFVFPAGKDIPTLVQVTMGRG